MTIELTTEEHNYLENCFNGYTIDTAYASPDDSKDEGVTTIILPTERIVSCIYHYYNDSLTVFRVDEAPPPIEITKINNLIENSEQFRSLLNN
jgi:hypothetical protein